MAVLYKSADPRGPSGDPTTGHDNSSSRSGPRRRKMEMDIWKTTLRTLNLIHNYSNLYLSKKFAPRIMLTLYSKLQASRASYAGAAPLIQTR